MQTQELFIAIEKGQTSFEKLVFDGAKFRNCTLDHILFINCTFIRCDFRNSSIRYCNFSNNYLAYSDFTECDLRHSIFDYAVMYRSNLYRANCRFASFKETLVSLNYVKDAINMNLTEVINNIGGNHRNKPPYAFVSDDTGE